MEKNISEQCKRLVNHCATCLEEDRKLLETIREALDNIDKDNRRLMSLIKETKILIQNN